MIDVHAHLYTAPLVEYLGGNPATAAGARRAELAGAGDDEAHLEDRLALMDGAGVTRQLLSAPPAPYPAGEAEGIALACAINDAMTRFVARRPDRFSALASLPLPHVEPAIAEARRCLGPGGMAGVMLQAFCGTLSIAHERFDPLFGELDRLSALVLVHPCVNGICSPFITEWGLSGSIGPTLEDTTIALHLIARRIPERFPAIRFIIPHLGGSLPMLMSRLDHQMAAGVGGLNEPPSASVRRLWYDSVTHGSVPALRCACDAIGSDRILVGSDFPFLTQYEPYAKTVGYQRRAELSAEAIDAIERGNAETLLTRS
jgi:predicted TIM-barrel fold metal-dependent hydrolase